MIAFVGGMACALLAASSVTCLRAGLARYAGERCWTLAEQQGPLEIAHSARQRQI